jgi:hypothetical protein
VFASVAYLVIIPLLCNFASPLFLVAYLFGIPAVLLPVLIGAHRRGEVWRALRSVPGFFVLRLVNGLFMLRALFSEFVLKRSLHVYEKGH